MNEQVRQARLRQVLQGKIAMGGSLSDQIRSTLERKVAMGGAFANNWVSFIKMVQKEGRDLGYELTYGESMMIAAPLWADMKQTVGKVAPVYAKKGAPRRNRKGLCRDKKGHFVKCTPAEKASHIEAVQDSLEAVARAAPELSSEAREAIEVLQEELEEPTQAAPAMVAEAEKFLADVGIAPPPLPPRPVSAEDKVRAAIEENYQEIQRAKSRVSSYRPSDPEREEAEQRVLDLEDEGLRLDDELEDIVRPGWRDISIPEDEEDPMGTLGLGGARKKAPKRARSRSRTPKRASVGRSRSRSASRSRSRSRSRTPVKAGVSGRSVSRRRSRSRSRSRTPVRAGVSAGRSVSRRRSRSRSRTPVKAAVSRRRSRSRSRSRTPAKASVSRSRSASRSRSRSRSRTPKAAGGRRPTPYRQRKSGKKQPKALADYRRGLAAYKAKHPGLTHKQAQKAYKKAARK